MAAIKRTLGKKVVQNKSEQEDTQLLTVNPLTMVSVKIKRSGPYGCWGIEAFKSVPVPEGEDSDEVLNNLIEALTGTVNAYAESDEVKVIEESVVGTGYDENQEIDQPELNGGETPEEGLNEPEDSGATEEMIREMDKKELLAFIKENNIEVNPKEYKALSDLADAVIEAIAADSGITEDEIREMDKKELIAFIKENDLAVDPKEYKKLPDLVEAVIEALGADEAPPEESEEVGVTEDEIREMDKKEIIAFIKENDLGINPKDYKALSDLQDAVIEQISGGEDLTSEAVMEMTKEELIELINEQGIEVNPKEYKKVEDLAEAVVEALFGEESSEQFGDFENTDFGTE